MPRGGRGHRRMVVRGGAQRSPDLMQLPEAQVSLGAGRADLVERVPQAPLADANHARQLRHRHGLAEMLAKKCLRAPDDRSTRLNRVAVRMIDRRMTQAAI